MSDNGKSGSGPDTLTFTANQLDVAKRPFEVRLADVDPSGCPPRWRLVLSVEKFTTAYGIAVAQLYAKLCEPTDFYPDDGAPRFEGSVCRDGIETLTLSPDSLRVRFFADADMRVRNGPPGKSVSATLVRDLIVSLAGLPPPDAPTRLAAALKRLCRDADVYAFQAGGSGGGEVATVTCQPDSERRAGLRAWQEKTERERRFLEIVRGGDPDAAVTAAAVEDYPARRDAARSCR